MSDDIVTWLRACIDAEDRDPRRHWTGCSYPRGGKCSCAGSLQDENARRRRMCAAHRAIIDEHSTTEIASLERETWGRVVDVCRSCRVDAERQVVAPCPTLRALASIYSDRPGYREEWRP